METHGTPLKEGQIARFAGVGAKAFSLIASALGGDRIDELCRDEAALQQILRVTLAQGGRCPKPWMTVVYGFSRNAAEYLSEFKKFRPYEIIVDDFGKDLLSQHAFMCSRTREHRQLAKVTVWDLGFGTGDIAQYGEIVKRALALGLSLCPPDMGPALRMHYTNQPGDEELHVAMEPIVNDSGMPSIFVLRRVARQLILGGCVAQNATPFGVTNTFVFVRP